MTPRDRILLAVRLLGGQRNLAREIPTGDRNVRRWAAGDGEPSAEMLEGARRALARRHAELAAALVDWPGDSRPDDEVSAVLREATGCPQCDREVQVCHFVCALPSRRALALEAAGKIRRRLMENPRRWAWEATTPARKP